MNDGIGDYRMDGWTDPTESSMTKAGVGWKIYDPVGWLREYISPKYLENIPIYHPSYINMSDHQDLKLDPNSIIWRRLWKTSQKLTRWREPTLTRRTSLPEEVRNRVLRIIAKEANWIAGSTAITKSQSPRGNPSPPRPPVEVACRPSRTRVMQDRPLEVLVVGETLYLYLEVRENAVSSVLIKLGGKGQQPIYFVNKVMLPAKKRYMAIEKLAFALVTLARKLKPYFQAHPIVVLSDQPFREILHRPEVFGRLTKWAIELIEFDLEYEKERNKGPIAS
ncbi:hypothetical protein CRG98_029212 [Punica granatum]|uniref:Reverse transcriptase RNase H-like domain-containing protein n=1 Tax=Punica granatum TaxID=22663 RepID=A0A2I0J2C0_PUNGR|nr:hypothetical protein CRG98_029212 [Punica granatum]